MIKWKYLVRYFSWRQELLLLRVKLYILFKYYSLGTSTPELERFTVFGEDTGGDADIFTHIDGGLSDWVSMCYYNGHLG